MADNVKTFNPRLPVVLHDALKDAAKDAGKSQNAIIIEAMEDGISRYSSEIETYNDYVYTFIRIPAGMHDKMRKLANAKYTTMNGIMMSFLEDYLEVGVNEDVLFRKQKENGDEYE